MLINADEKVILWITEKEISCWTNFEKICTEELNRRVNEETIVELSNFSRLPNQGMHEYAAEFIKKAKEKRCTEGIIKVALAQMLWQSPDPELRARVMLAKNLDEEMLIIDANVISKRKSSKCGNCGKL